MDPIVNGKVSPFLIHRFAVPLPPPGKVLCGTHPYKFQFIGLLRETDKHIAQNIVFSQGLCREGGSPGRCKPTGPGFSEIH